MKAEGRDATWKPRRGAAFHVLSTGAVRPGTALPEGAAAIMAHADVLSITTPALLKGLVCPKLLVGIGPLGSEASGAHIESALDYSPDGLVVDDIVGGTELMRLGAKLAVAEAVAGIADGATGIIVAFTGKATGLLACPTLPGASRRLRALLWRPSWPDADLPEALRYGRALMLLTADAAGVPAIDGSPSAGFDARHRFEQSRRQGFAGLLVSDPAEIEALS